MEKIWKNIGHWLNVVLKITVMAAVAFPFVWIISTSLKTYPETQIFPPKIIPESLHFENYAAAFHAMPFFKYLRNSIFVAFSVLLLQYLVIIPAAYGFARGKFRGKNFLFGMVLLGFMIPQQVTFVPVYLMFSKLGMLRSFIPLIAPFVANAFGIFLLRQYFMQIPEEIIEAARLDQASPFKILWKIMIPMAKTPIFTVGLLSFISNWNSYFWPLIMTNHDDFRTLPIGVAMMTDAEGGRIWNEMMAGNMLLILPVLVMYLVASKQIRRAFTYSGIK